MLDIQVTRNGAPGRPLVNTMLKRNFLNYLATVSFSDNIALWGLSWLVGAVPRLELTVVLSLSPVNSNLTD
jgi:hypothetical protein